MTGLLKRGVTLLELMVVLVIISILSTVAVGIYSKEVIRAKYAKARQEIRTLEIAITQYEVDTGQLPPSGSGDFVNVGNINPLTPIEGSGMLQLVLRHSLSGNLNQPASSRWMGPYIDWDYNRMGSLDGVPITSPNNSNMSIAAVNFLDPWGNPYHYIRHDDYDQGGTQLPAANPFAASETYYNPSTFQIYSVGINGTTFPTPNRGTEPDDVTNFFSPNN